MINEHLGKSLCHSCDATIDANDDRIVLMAVEVRGEEKETAGRGDSCTRTFCMQCAAEMPSFEIANPWKRQSDWAAHPSAGDPKDDIMERAVSLPSIAERRRRRNQRSDQSDDEALGKTLAHRESVEKWIPNVPRHDSSPPDDTDLRIRVQMFVRGPKAKRLRGQLRPIAALWSLGLEQKHIAEMIGMSPPTLSRRLEQVLATVNRTS